MRPKGEVTMTSWTIEGFFEARIASRNRRWLRLAEYGFRAEHGSRRSTRADGGLAYRSRTRRRNRTTSGRVSDSREYARSSPPTTGVYGSRRSYPRRSRCRTMAVFHGAFARRRSTSSRNRPWARWFRTRSISRNNARSLWAARSSPVVHAGQPHACRSASPCGNTPSAVWKNPRALSSPMRLESTTSTPAYTRTAKFEGLASPVTARTFPGPSTSRTLCTAATKSRGERSNSGPLARKTASAAFAAPTSESPPTIARSPTGPAGGMSRSAIDAGTPFEGGRSSVWPADWGANRLPLTRICGRGSAVRSRTNSPSAYAGALREGRSTNRTIGMANERPPRCHSAVRPRPPRWRISSIERTRMPAARHKVADLTGRVSLPRDPERRRATAARSDSIERRRVALDQCEFLRLERTVVDAQDDRRAVQRDLLVDVLQEVQDPREVVVDHEVLDPVQGDHRPRAVAHEVPDEVAEAVQVVRVDVVLPEGRRQPDDADVAVPAATEDVVRVLAGDVHRPPPGVDRLVEVA